MGTIATMEPLLPKRPTPRFPGKLMLCNIGRVGDTILRNSILDSAFRTYATVDYICGPHNVELLRSDARLGRIVMLENTFSGIAGLLKAALSRRYDSFIDLKDHWSSTSAVVSKFFRGRVKTGWNHERWRPFDRDASRVVRQNAHKMEVMQCIGRLAGLEPGEYKPTLVLTPDSIQWFEQNHPQEKPFILLNISATSFDRVWPVAHWVRYVPSPGFSWNTIQNTILRWNEVFQMMSFPRGLRRCSRIRTHY